MDTSPLGSITSIGDDVSDDPEERQYHSENKGTLLPCPTKLRPGEEVHIVAPARDWGKYPV